MTCSNSLSNFRSINLQIHYQQIQTTTFKMASHRSSISANHGRGKKSQSLMRSTVPPTFFGLFVPPRASRVTRGPRQSHCHGVSRSRYVRICFNNGVQSVVKDVCTDECKEELIEVTMMTTTIIINLVIFMDLFMIQSHYKLIKSHKEM